MRRPASTRPPIASGTGRLRNGSVLLDQPSQRLDREQAAGFAGRAVGDFVLLVDREDSHAVEHALAGVIEQPDGLGGSRSVAEPIEADVDGIGPVGETGPGSVRCRDPAAVSNCHCG